MGLAAFVVKLGGTAAVNFHPSNFWKALTWTLAICAVFRRASYPKAHSLPDVEFVLRSPKRQRCVKYKILRMFTSRKSFIARIFSWPEMGWGLLCLVLLYIYFNRFEDVRKGHVISVITGNYQRQQTYQRVVGSDVIASSDVRVSSDDVNIDIQNIVMQENATEKPKPADGGTGGGPEIINGFPKPEIEFINKKRDKLPKEKDETVRILSWTAKYDDETEWFTQKQAGRCDMGEPGVRCEYTSDRGLYNYSDAVLIRLRLIPEYGIPEYRFASHKWVYVEFESAVYASRPWFSAYTHIFNITNTQNPNSTIPQPRPQVIKKANPSSTVVNYAKDKTKKVAWMVSNCHTQGRREVYAEELAKYIPIDIFGKCGNLTCPKSRVECEQTLLNYKFYLSFENSLCQDYFTEKFWRTMKKPIIGVTLGAADYTGYVPKGSYIDVRDFSSPKQLAEFLHRLDNNDEEYNAFIHHKEQYDINFENEERHICDMCKAVYKNRHKVQVMKDAQDFYSQTKNCFTPKEFYKNIAPELNVPGKFFN